MAVAEAEPSRHTRRRRILVCVTWLWLPAAVLLCGVLAWSVHRERSYRPPAVVEDLPSPNGYDLLHQAADALEGQQDGQPPRFDVYLRANTEVFAAVDKALSMPIVVPAPKPGERAKRQGHDPMWSLSALLSARASLCVRSGDHRGAVEADWRQIRLGLAMCRGSDLRVAEGGLTAASMTATHLASEVGSLDAAAAKAWTARLEPLLANAPTLGTVFSRCAPVEAGTDLIADRLWAQAGYLQAPPPATRYQQRLVWLQSLASGLDGPMTQWREPVMPHRDRSAVPFRWFAMETAKSMVASVAELRVACAGTALAAYHAECGAWPASLDALVPRYLHCVPTDPCGGQPLHYRLDEGRPLCWSVGSDGRDDDGDSVDVERLAPNPRGDIVWPRPAPRR